MTTNHMRHVALPALVLTLEGAGALALLVAEAPHDAIGFAAGHGAASLAAAALVRLAPAAYQRPRQAERGWRHHPGVAFSLITLLLPVFGVLGILAGLLPALHRPARQRERTWRRVSVPRLEPDQPARAAGAADIRGRSLLEIFEDEASPVTSRMAAVLAAGQLCTRAGVPILRRALRDPRDEVRMLACALLDRRDAELHAHIRGLEVALEANARDPLASAELHHRLAELHWELANTELATGAVKDSALASAARHARAALAAVDQARILDPTRRSQDPGPLLLLLLGRALLGQGALEDAERALLAAGERGVPASTTGPLLAELAYQRRRFADVARHLRASRADAHAGPRRFWLGAEARDRG